MIKKAFVFAFSEYGLFSSKRSQHEAMGFIIIVALVMVVGVIFLGIKMNQDRAVQQYSDSNIINFLTASSRYTSDCFDRARCTQGFCSLNELKQKCYDNNEKCNIGTDDRYSCDILNYTYSDMLSKSWRIYNDSPVKYYDLKVKYRTICNDSATASLLSLVDITAGDSTQCYVRKIGQESFPYNHGCIVSELKICGKDAV